jgi:4-amino-4-deoxy-L-arabinose transferase-like glycosyltransferase
VLTETLERRRLAIRRASLSHPPLESLGATAVTVAFMVVSFVWLAMDRQVPIFDNGVHLTWATHYHDMIASGDLLRPFETWIRYPPLVHLVGAAGMFIGGKDVAPAITAENVVFVPLLALGCYQAGRIAFNRLAGALAVVYALGTPLIAAQFHIFLLDAPEAAMVAVSVWLLLASGRFEKLRMAAAAGVACGLGMLVKQSFVYFVAGLVVILLVRGGWRQWQGVAVFAGLGALVGLPWYLAHFSDLTAYAGSVQAETAAQASNAPGSPLPPRWSRKNLGWYFWSGVNLQLLAPLLSFAVVGTVWTIVRFLRQRSPTDFTPELVIGGLVAWGGVTLTLPHDARYSLPALAYLAVLGTGWITVLPTLLRRAAVIALVVIATVNHVGGSFGLGRHFGLTLPGAPAGSPLMERQITIYTPIGGAPRRDGDVLGLMRALKRSGARAVHWDLGAESIGWNFTHQGVEAYAVMAGLEPSVPTDYTAIRPLDAYLLRWPLEPAQKPPCIRLDEFTGIWVRRGNPLRPGMPFYCPLREPAYYGP